MTDAGHWFSAQLEPVLSPQLEGGGRSSLLSTATHPGHSPHVPLVPQVPSPRALGASLPGNQLGSPYRNSPCPCCWLPLGHPRKQVCVSSTCQEPRGDGLFTKPLGCHRLEGGLDRALPCEPLTSRIMGSPVSMPQGWHPSTQHVGDIDPKVSATQQ